jgi:hypothetical protein
VSLTTIPINKGIFIGGKEKLGVEVPRDTFNSTG